jgi:hypothetical protein
MRDTVVLMRASLAEEEEMFEAQKCLTVYPTRAKVPENCLVVGRYSVLPYYQELEADLAEHNSILINSYSQHSFVADLGAWYPYLQDRTPKTWFSLENFMKNKPEGSFILKGNTNSKKQQWDTHMFAKTREDVPRVYRNLSDDSFLSDQNIYIREYVPLKSFGEGIRGLPITEEYRFFVLDGHIVGSGYYWSQFPEVQEEHGLGPWLVDAGWLRDSIDKVAGKIRFFVMDVARTAVGDWIVIELNDGQMSGLSDVKANVLYSNIYQKLAKGYT